MPFTMNMTEDKEIDPRQENYRVRVPISGELDSDTATNLR